MRALILVSTLLLALLALPAPAQANPCYLDDAPCMVDCLEHTPCGVYNPNPTLVPCAAGKTGVGVDTGDRTVNACVAVPTVTLASCPGNGLGVVVIVNGNPTPVCTGA